MYYYYSDATKENFKEKMQSLTKAWQLAVQKLRTHGIFTFQ